MRRSVIETVLGAMVLLVAAVFLIFAYTSSDLKPVLGYQVTARFNSIDGLTVGSDVRIGGVKVGSVVAQEIDQEAYQAVVDFTVLPEIRLPEDTQVSVTSSGLLGGKYLKLDPGNADDMVSNGGELRNTKDVISLEELLGKVIFVVTDESPDG